MEFTISLLSAQRTEPAAVLMGVFMIAGGLICFVIANNKGEIASKNESKPKPLRWGIVSIIFVVVGIFTLMLAPKKHSENITNNNENQTESTSTKRDCSRCNGSGVIRTYGAYGCKDLSHFHPGMDCTKEDHGSECITSGSKTCPCCNGKKYFN